MKIYNLKSGILSILLSFLILSYSFLGTLIPPVSASSSGSTQTAFILTQPCGSACSAVGNSASAPLVEFVYDTTNGANNSGSYVKFNNITSAGNANRYYNNSLIPSSSLQAIATLFGYTNDANGILQTFGVSTLKVKMIGKKEFDAITYAGDSTTTTTYFYWLLSDGYNYDSGTAPTNKGGNFLTFIDNSINDINLVQYNNTITGYFYTKNYIGNGTVLNTQSKQFIINGGILDGFVIPVNPVGNAATVYYIQSTNIYNTKLAGTAGLAVAMYGGQSGSCNDMLQWYPYYYAGTCTPSVATQFGKVVNSYIVVLQNSVNGYDFLPIIQNSYISLKNNSSIGSHYVINSIIDGNGGTGGIGIFYYSYKNYIVNVGNYVSAVYTYKNLIYNNANVFLMPGNTYSNIIYNNSNVAISRAGVSSGSLVQYKQSSFGYASESPAITADWIYHNTFFNNTNYNSLAPSIYYIDVSSMATMKSGIYGSALSLVQTPLNVNLLNKFYAANYVSNLLNAIDNNNDSVNELSFPFLYMNLIKSSKPSDLSGESYCVNSSTVGKKTDNTPCAYTSFQSFPGYLGTPVTINSTDAVNTISY